MLVIGNGESRKDIDLNNQYDTKIGCNAIHRDYHVDHLICVDRRMAQEAIDANLKRTQIYTRKDWISWFPQGVTTVPNLPYKGTQTPDEPMQWGSGPYAVLLASRLCYEFNQPIRLIGFDLYSDTTTVNNIYKDSINYDANDKRPVNPKYWIYQIGKIFENFTQTQFKIYNKIGWILPKEWQLPNVSLDNVNTF